jgi:hypothetical protein
VVESGSSDKEAGAGTDEVGEDAPSPPHATTKNLGVGVLGGGSSSGKDDLED